MFEPNEMDWGALLPAALGLVWRHEAITRLVMGLPATAAVSSQSTGGGGQGRVWSQDGLSRIQHTTLHVRLSVIYDNWAGVPNACLA